MHFHNAEFVSWLDKAELTLDVERETPLTVSNVAPTALLWRDQLPSPKETKY